LIVRRCCGAGAKLRIVLAVLGMYVCSPSGAPAASQALWVFPSSSFANPVTDATARQTLVTNSAASGVGLLYLSVYSSTPNAAGRYMYDDAAIANLIAQAHNAGVRVDAAYGAPAGSTGGVASCLCR